MIAKHAPNEGDDVHNGTPGADCGCKWCTPDESDAPGDDPG